MYLCVWFFFPAAAHASHQWVSNEKKPEAHRLERYDAGTASGYSQWPAFTDWKWVQNTHKSLTSTSNSRNEQESLWGKTRSCILTPTLYSGCESTSIYVSQLKGLYQLTVSPEHLLLPQCTDHWSWCSGMNNLSSYLKRLQKSPWVQNHELVLFFFYLQQTFPLKISFCQCFILSGKAERTIPETCDAKTTTDTWSNKGFVRSFNEPIVGHFRQSNTVRYFI